MQALELALFFHFKLNTMNIPSTKRFLLHIALITILSSFSDPIYSQPSDQQKFNCSGIYMVSTTGDNIESRRVPYGTDGMIFYSPFFKSYSIVFQAEDEVSELKFKYVGELQGQTKYYLEDGGDLQYFYAVYTVDEMVRLGKQKFLSATSHNGKNVWFYLEGISSLKDFGNNLKKTPQVSKKTVYFAKDVVVEYVDGYDQAISSAGHGRDGYLSYDEIDHSFLLMYTLNGIDRTDKLIPSRMNDQLIYTNGTDKYKMSGTLRLGETMSFTDTKLSVTGGSKCIRFKEISLVEQKED